MDIEELNNKIIPEWLENLEKDIPFGGNSDDDRFESFFNESPVFIKKSLSVLWGKWVNEFNDYKADKKGKIYWRLKPRVIEDYNHYVIQSCFFISEG